MHAKVFDTKVISADNIGALNHQLSSLGNKWAPHGEMQMRTDGHGYVYFYLVMVQVEYSL